MSWSLSTFICSAAALAGALAPAEALAAAAEDYRRFCAACHGESGDGNGPISRFLDPRPRDFFAGVFKFRSTASGALPTDEDLSRVIDDGLPGTAMTGWRSVLPAPRRKALVEFLKTLSPRFASEAAPEPLSLGEPAGSPDPAQGRAAWERLGCAHCHGDDGRGSGPAAGELKDDQGRLSRPPDLTAEGKLRARDEREVVRALLTGLDGTPMPSYDGAVTDRNEAWALARWLASVKRPSPAWRKFLFEEALTFEEKKP